MGARFHDMDSTHVILVDQDFAGTIKSDKAGEYVFTQAIIVLPIVVIGLLLERFGPWDDQSRDEKLDGL